MHRLRLLKVLLVAVFLNAVLGVPLHAAAHLMAGGPAASHADAGAFGAHEDASHSHEGDESGEGHSDPSHGPCAACLAHAQACSAPAGQGSAWRPRDWREPPVRPANAQTPVISASRWAPSPRGPPAA
jgi:hypothetical protein